ncbi:uncharacterized protein BDZ83DRAFT_630518 [Colletotrichum acutatum]|uniref:Uncharacterized protein n=1 Tax=Glomerella acutata TaxID=27357 RepID=A0AAD8UFB5_GLOAC|nr:uncharacterized protein BDZ83DRAFT_630518 [Colletotrichum acutatum]KAK1721197.1 hypothetical protein BDZ83DRAFT_630518 [Colletotrichum acutatum]
MPRTTAATWLQLARGGEQATPESPALMPTPRPQIASVGKGRRHLSRRARMGHADQT